MGACNGDKAQGPDGFSFAFIKQFWEVLKYDIVSAVHQFYSTAFIDGGSNSSFITLIPKVNDPIYFPDFRPISLIGCLYKIIAKLLSTRLQKVINVNYW